MFDLFTTLQNPEGEMLEIVAHPTSLSLARNICAMANAKGGQIVVGAEERGKTIVGVEPIRLDFLVSEAMGMLIPACSIELDKTYYENKLVGIITVHPSMDRISLDGISYIRREDRTDILIRNIPEYVDVRSQKMTVWEIMTKIENRELILSDTHRRRWGVAKERRYIESLIVHIPCPPIYIDGTRRKWRVLDGEKRIKAIAGFEADEYVLGSLNYIDKALGRICYSNLPNSFKIKLDNAKIDAYIFNPGTPKDVMEDITNRIRQK